MRLFWQFAGAWSDSRKIYKKTFQNNSLSNESAAPKGFVLGNSSLTGRRDVGLLNVKFAQTPKRLPPRRS